MFLRGVVVVLGSHVALTIVAWKYLSPITAEHFDGPVWAWSVAVPMLLATLIWGAKHDTKPAPDRVVDRPRESMSIQSLNAVLRARNVLERPNNTNPAPPGITLGAVPRTIGGGELNTWNLPQTCGKSYLDVVKIHEVLAGAFATPLPCFHILPGRHPGQFRTWQADKDPFGGAFLSHPLLKVERWDVFEPAPFGHNAMGETAFIALVYSALMVAAMPRKGKSYAERAVLVGAILDPSVRFHVFDAKPGQTWEQLRGMSDDFVNGASEAKCEQVAVALERMVLGLEDIGLRVPGSRITAKTARDPRVGVPIRVVLLDEAHRYLDSKQFGKRISEALETIAKVGPSLGYIVHLITQRPDSETITTAIRNVLAQRLVLKVDSKEDSNFSIGGSNLASNGVDASTITHRGVAWFRPDLDADGRPDADDTVRQVRIFDMNDDVWEAFCRTGYLLRGLDPGLATLPDPDALDIPDPDDEQLPAATLLTRFRRYAPEALPDRVTDAKSMGEWLSNDLKIPAKRDTRGSGIRWRSRLSVEAAAGLSAGCLGVDETGPEVDGADNPPTAPRQPADNPPSTPTDTP